MHLNLTSLARDTAISIRLWSIGLGLSGTRPLSVQSDQLASLWLFSLYIEQTNRFNIVYKFLNTKLKGFGNKL